MKTVHKSRRVNKSSIGAIAAMFFAPMMLCAAEFTVPESGIFEVTDENNLSNNRLDIAGDAKLKLSGTVADGTFPLKLNLRFTAAATLTVVAEDCETVRMTGCVRDSSGKAVISFPQGVKSFVMGATNVDWDGTNFPVLQSDVSFDDEEGKLVFTNDVTVAKRVSCNWVAAKGSRLVLMAKHAIADGDFALTDYNVHIAQRESFANGAKITVPAGRTLIVRPFSFNDNTKGGLSGTDASITNDVELAGGSIIHYNNNHIKGLTGTISGNGNVTFSGNGDITAFRGNFDWTGSLQASGIGTSGSITYTLIPTNGATIVPAIKMNHVHGTAFKFAVAGYQSMPTSVRLTSLSQSNSDTDKMKPVTLRVLKNQTITAGEVSGLVDVVADGTGAAFVVEQLKANAKLSICPGVALRVESFEAGAKVYLKDDTSGKRNWSVSGPGEGDAIALPIVYPEDVEGASLSFGGKLIFSVKEPIPAKDITILPGADISAAVVEDVQIKNNGGTFTQLVKTWRDKVKLWVDASDADTMTLADLDFPNYASNIGNTRISEWRDCRPDRQGEGALRLRMTAFDNGSSISSTTAGGFPEKTTINGLSAVKFHTTRGRLRPSTGKDKNTSVRVKCALFVFNSSDGGGNAFFCTADSLFRRIEATGKDVNADKNTLKAAPLIYTDENERFSFSTNGVAVVATNTLLSGGWQIISFVDNTSEGVEITNIGHMNNVSNGKGNGGQIYAEILFFDEMPTDEERDAAETYLAKKWNLPLGHEEVTASYDVNLSSLYGSGTVELASDAVAERGVFSGVVNLNGNRLEIPSHEVPFTEATIPAEGRQLWIDPSAEGALVMGGVEGKPSEVAYIHARNNDGILTDPTSYCVASPYPDNGNGRRVRLVEGSRASGDIMPWLVFKDGYTDGQGNHLLIRKGIPQTLADVPKEYGDNSFKAISVKSGFFVLDTTNGGGTILTSAANGTTDAFRRRSLYDTKGTKIWINDCSKDVRESDTYLDGVKVEGTNSTFSLRPEIFTFNFKPGASSAAAKVFGFWGNGSTQSWNQEIMGEWILYSNTQTDATRRAIEAYLMWKWLGKLQIGFSDFRGMSVTGEGVLAVDGPEQMPKLDDFAGSLEFTRTEWAFTLPAEGGAAAVDAVELSGREIALPSEISVNIDLNGAPNGTYTLFSAADISGAGGITLGVESKVGNKIVSFIVDEDEIAVRIIPRGTVFTVR